MSIHIAESPQMSHMDSACRDLTKYLHKDT